MSPIIRGHFDHLVQKGQRTILWVALSRDDGERLQELLGPRPHRSQSIPIALAFGPAAELAAEISGAARTEETPAPPAAPEPPLPTVSLAARVEEIVELTLKVRDLTDAANAEPDLDRRAQILALRDGVARALRVARGTLDGGLRRIIRETIA